MIPAWAACLPWQADDRAISAGDTTGVVNGPPVGKKCIVALGAEAGGIDVLRADARMYQLLTADGPEIKMVGTGLEVVHPCGEFLAIVDEFRAAGSQGGADHRADGLGCDTVLLHTGDGLADDTQHTAAPTAVDGGHHLRLRCPEQHRLAIGLLDEQAGARQGGDDGIIALGFAADVMLLRKQDAVIVDLLDRDQLGQAKSLLRQAAVGTNIFWGIPHRKTEVKRGKGRIADPAKTVEHAMRYWKYGNG